MLVHFSKTKAFLVFAFKEFFDLVEFVETEFVTAV